MGSHVRTPSLLAILFSFEYAFAHFEKNTTDNSEDAKTYKGAITKKKKKKPKTKVPGADASETTPLKSGENTSSASDMPASQTLTQA